MHAKDTYDLRLKCFFFTHNFLKVGVVQSHIFAQDAPTLQSTTAPKKTGKTIIAHPAQDSDFKRQRIILRKP
jgi:hypothetical protein